MPKYRYDGTDALRDVARYLIAGKKRAAVRPQQTANSPASALPHPRGPHIQ